MAKKLQRKIKVGPKPAAAPGREGEKTRSGRSLFGGRISGAKVSEFTIQLSTLLDAGIPIVRALRVLEGQVPKGPFKEVIGQVTRDVEGGSSLSESLEKHNKAFDGLYVNMVKAGEIGGIQDVILLRLADFRTRMREIRTKVVGALAYPAIVLIIALGVIGILLVFVIPKFKEIFEKEEITLPGLTRFMLRLSELAQAYFPFIILGVAGIYGLHRLLLARSKGYRLRRDRLLLRLPLVGDLLKKFQVARFARTFGTLIQSGVPHLDGLDIVKGSLANLEVRRGVEKVYGSIKEGEGMSRPMQDSMVFDDLVVNMVDVGEETGELDGMLLKIADRYEDEVDHTVSTVTKIIEPLLITALAVVVGLIVAALFLPLLQLMEKLGQGI